MKRKQKKLKLPDLKVQSFVTSLDSLDAGALDKAYGGTDWFCGPTATETACSTTDMWGLTTCGGSGCPKP